MNVNGLTIVNLAGVWLTTFPGFFLLAVAVLVVVFFFIGIGSAYLSDRPGNKNN